MKNPQLVDCGFFVFVSLKRLLSFYLFVTIDDV